MPDLGTYAVYVLGAYGAALLILLGVVAATLRASARAKRELTALEARHLRRRRPA